MPSTLDEELENAQKMRVVIRPQTALERCVSLLCAPPARCNSVDWSLPDGELTELFIEGSREYFLMENPLPKALYKRFDTIVQRPLLRMILGPQSFTHQEVIISIAVQCSKIGAAARILTEDDAKLVASKAHRISELLLAMCTEAKTSYTARKSFVKPSQELVFSGATS